MEYENKKEFRGVWIRASLWRRKDLTWFEKCLIAEIDCFADNCFASNAYLAEMMNTTESRLSNALTKLRKLGLVIDAGFNGRVRQILIADNVSSDPKINNPSEKIVESGFTQRLRQGSHIGEGRLHTEVNIYTSGEQSIEKKPLTPLQGEVENSAMASSSTDDFENEFLFSSERAKAQGSKSTDFNSRPPHSGKKPIKRDSRKSPPTEIPSDLDCPAFREVWNDFLTHRKEKKKAVTPTNERALLKKLRSWGTSKAVDALQNSVTNGWLGVFPPKEEEWKPTTI